jgi:hypothetical protein
MRGRRRIHGPIPEEKERNVVPEDKPTPHREIKERTMKKCFILVAVSFVLVFAHSAFALNPLVTSRGETVYVPASWHEITSTGQLTTSRLVIRNIDPSGAIIQIYSVAFIGVDGIAIKNLMDGHDCDGNPTALTINLGPFQSTSFTITTGCIPRYPQSEVRRPGWLVDWVAVNKKDTIEPSIGALIDILTPTYIYGHTGTPFFVIDAESSVAGTVIVVK